jgi:hypothetical protein
MNECKHGNVDFTCKLCAHEQAAEVFREHTAEVFDTDTLALLIDPQFTGTVTYHGIPVEELIAAARAVVNAYQEEIPGVGEMTTDVIERLRAALEAK